MKEETIRLRFGWCRNSLSISPSPESFKEDPLSRLSSSSSSQMKGTIYKASPPLPQIRSGSQGLGESGGCGQVSSFQRDRSEHPNGNIKKILSRCQSCSSEPLWLSSITEQQLLCPFDHGWSSSHGWIKFLIACVTAQDSWCVKMVLKAPAYLGAVSRYRAAAVGS